MKIRLHPLRENDAQNFPQRWRYRRQMVGMILLWAYRANAVHVLHTASGPLPLRYYDRDGKPVDSELPQPPADQNAFITRDLFLATLNGPPLAACFRRIWRKLTTSPATATLLVIDTERKIEACWRMDVGDQSTVFDLIDVHHRG